MTRLDVYLCEQNHFDTRSRAQKAIKDGCISVNAKVLTKASHQVEDTDLIELVKAPLKYVSRGALKLVKAIEEFEIDFSDKVVLDIGASTGGFTEVALEHGASRLYALDVGRDQLHPKVKADSRVVNMEQTNFRYCQLNDFDQEVDITVIDVSFISLKLIFPTLGDILTENKQVVALIKPQFEAGKKALNKKGIIKDPKVHKEVIEDISQYVKNFNFRVIKVIDSPILGGDGNKEFLAYLVK